MLRGILRDILSLYLGYKIIKIWLFGSAFTSDVGWAAVALLVLALWFLMERIGVL